MYAIRRISRWIDKRRPQNVSPQGRALLYQHPEYLEAVRRREDQAEICRRNPSPRNRSRLDRLAQDVNETFNRLLRALKKERQLSGTAVHGEEAKEVLRTEVKMPPEQIRLLEKLFIWPTSHSLDGFDDSQTASRKRRASKEPKPDVHPPPSGPLQDAECFGNRSLPEHRRVQKWSKYKSTLRHFRRKHLDDRKCNFCDIELLHEMHLRNHAAEVHRLVT
ncbi:hypothetical protein V8E54_006190 [Elaphomyces granulatus]